jgi:two-component system nitrogen regulation response regulator NtrX
MEVELFGIEQSNGEQARKPGALEEAHGGTLFIDEIADMPRETQNKILRVLVDQTFQRSGGTVKIHVDVRIVSSTARNLEEEIAEGRFREDLFHRLSVVPIRVPPLSERREDIPELIGYFMDQISAATGLPKRQIGQDAMAVLQSHVWPGNVRQLRNNVDRRHAAAGCRLDGAGDADQQQWRAHHGPSAARGPRGVRTRLPDRPDQPFLGKYLAHCGIRRYGALGATPQAEGARGRLIPQGESSNSMQLRDEKLWEVSDIAEMLEQWELANFKQEYQFVVRQYATGKGHSASVLWRGGEVDSIFSFYKRLTL